MIDLSGQFMLLYSCHWADDAQQSLKGSEVRPIVDSFYMRGADSSIVMNLFEFKIKILWLCSFSIYLALPLMKVPYISQR